MIERIEAFVYRIPLEHPVQLATRTISSRDWLIVHVTARDGSSGTGFTYAGYDGGEAILNPICDQLGPALLAMPLAKPEDLWTRMDTACAATRTHLSDRALSALDIALHDACARRSGLTLAGYLAGQRTTPLRTYVGAGYYDPAGEESELRALRDLLASTGALEIKIKVGRHGLTREQRRLALFRSVMTDNHSISVDANGAFNDVGKAVQMLDAFDEVAPIEMFEDAFPDTRLDLYAMLRRERPETFVSTGELFTSEAQFQAALDMCAADVLQVDATACGGISAACRIARITSLANIPLESHWFPELHMQIASTNDAWRRVEIFADHSIINFGQIVRWNSSYLGHGMVVDDDADRFMLSKVNLVGSGTHCVE